MPRFRAAAALALSLAACGRTAPAARPALHAAAPAREGRLAVDGGHIWYRVTGTGGGTPLILLHGGPGVSSFYLKPFEALADERQVVRYDQLGSGKSDPLTDTTKMTIGHFVRELDSLRAHLGYAKVHLLGHSWGTLLAVEYHRAHPDRVASLTLESAFLDLPAWARDTRRLVGTLSDSARGAIARAEAEHRYDTPAFEAADREYSARYMTRHPVRADGDSIRRTMNEALYEYMQGPAEYVITGTLRDYDATPFLPTIRVPVLYTVGEFDEASAATVRRFARLTPGARFVMFPGAAHLTPWDAREQNVATVRAFLRSADRAKPRR
jgi:proline iminopeptidase